MQPKCTDQTLRHIIKSNYSIALVWEVAFKLHSQSPSDWLKCPHIDQWQKTYCRLHESFWDQRVSENFCRHFLLRLFAIKHCRRFGEAVMKFTISWAVSRQLRTSLTLVECTNIESWERGFCSERRLLREAVLRCVPFPLTLPAPLYPCPTIWAGSKALLIGSAMVVSMPSLCVWMIMN